MSENCCSYQIGDDVYYGSTPKYRLNIDADESMSSYNFWVTLKGSNGEQVIAKNAMRHDENGYYFCMNTTQLGVGPVKAVVSAEMDEGCGGEDRMEIAVINRMAIIKMP